MLAPSIAALAFATLRISGRASTPHLDIGHWFNGGDGISLWLSHSTAPRRDLCRRPDGTMNKNVIITCAVTGSGDTADRSPHVPVTPKEIAQASIEAALLQVLDERAGLGAVAAQNRELAESYREARYHEGMLNLCRPSGTTPVAPS